jgi:small conductance mechanosensitive channel
MDAHLFIASPAGGSESMHLMFLMAIAAAERSIDLAASYFVPDDSADPGAGRGAPARGAVRILLPGEHIDSQTVRIASKAEWGELLQAGVEIAEYEPTMLHVKLLVVDREMVSVGSTNFDIRSLRLNDEASLNIYDRRTLYPRDSAERTMRMAGGMSAMATPSPQAPTQAPAPAPQISEADDAATRASLERRLQRVPGLERVTAAVDGGVARLGGEVLAEDERALAATIAANADGVHAVHNRIELSADIGRRFERSREQLLDSLMRLVAGLPLLAVAITIVLLAGWIGRLLGGRLRLPWLRSRNPYLDGLLRRAVQAAALLAGLLIALDLLGATALVGAVLGSAGLIGIIVGFAFRDLAENYLSGVLLSLRRPFEPGDHVMVDGHEGKVVSLNSRATILMTLDGNHLRLPNAQVFKGVLLNYTRNPKRRLRFTLGVGNEEDITLAQQIGRDTLQAMDGVLDDPPPNALVLEAGDSSMTLQFSAWVDQRVASFGKVQSEGIRLVKAALEDAGMDLPEPIYRVQMVERPAGRGEGAGRAARAQSGHVPPQADVSRDDALDAQIDEERARQKPGDDLLERPGETE